MRTSQVIAVLFVTLLVTASRGSAGEISNGSYRVLVNEFGVLLAGPPPGLRTVDALPVELHERFAEWFGLSFDDVTGHVEAVGLGNAPDWAGRVPVERIFTPSRGPKASGTSPLGVGMPEPPLVHAAEATLTGLTGIRAAPDMPTAPAHGFP